MNTIKSPANEQSDQANLPRRVALLIALFFWVVMLPSYMQGFRGQYLCWPRAMDGWKGSPEYGSVPIFVALLVMMPLMNRRVVTREESDLEARFGDSYLEYKNRVPRSL